ncbi:sialidase-1 [Saccharopolyspora antimicrobica]|uniref:exo-alpha-sialidase n=1 Tax=Saccharopolyspora antimicrobica TaxID=455193 RepID=A0A1I5JEL1_9PSEU|nr:sialidase family protein [Saccharopolyspora antimicrobica]RKT82496.1 sialidase-1 [Saccharopolyspora antimicrobica]SFO71089.1 sialidase-1 [Saccharopolyspora antimicrobica]
MRRITKIVGAAAGAALLCLGATQVSTGEPLAISGTTVFTKGEGGYNCFRIPAIVRTQDRSALLAFAEARRNNCDDTGYIDVVLKRSTDDGKSWQKLELVSPGDGDTRGNPVPVVDRETGRISLLTTHNPGPDCNGSGCRRTPFLQHSTDPSGKQWTEPVAQPQLKKPEWTKWYATGPGHGLQMTRGEHEGRMVAGINYEGADGLKGAGIVHSDDGGTTWQLGALDDRTGEKIKPQELSLLETVDAELYVAARNQDNSGTTVADGNRAHAVSADGGETFRETFSIVPQLRGPVVQGSVVRLRATTAGDPSNLILFSGPYNTDPNMDHRRHTMRIRTSSDEGATWQEVGTVVDATWSAYSDLINLGGGWAGLLYEAGSQESQDAHQTIRYARFSENDLAR